MIAWRMLRYLHSPEGQEFYVPVKLLIEGPNDPQMCDQERYCAIYG